MSKKSQSAFVNLSERVTFWLARAGSVGLAVMMLLTLFDVIGRAFNHPISGSVEVTELIMGIMIYLGVGYTTFLRGHIRVDILIINFKPRTQAILDFVTGLVGLFITVLISWQLFIQAHSRLINNETTQIWEVSLWPWAFIMAFASILMVTSLGLHLMTSSRVAFGLQDASTYVTTSQASE